MLGLRDARRSRRSGSSLSQDVVQLLFGFVGDRRGRARRDRGRRSPCSCVGLTAHSLIAVARPRVLRAPGHGDAGRGRADRRRRRTSSSRTSLVGPLGLERPRRRDRDRPPGSRRWCSSLLLRRRMPCAGPRAASGGRDAPDGARGRRRRRGRVGSCNGWLVDAWGVDPGFLLPARRGTAVATAAGGLVILARVARVADRGAAALSSGSWSTSSAAGAARDGQPAPTPRPATVDAGSPDAAAWDAFVEANPLGSYLQLDGWARGQGGQRLAVAPPARRGTGGVGAQVLLRRPGPLPWAFAYAPRGPVLRALGRGGDRARSRELARDRPPRRGAGRVSHLRIDPEIERGADRDEGGAVTGGARGRRLAAGRRRSSPSRPASIDLAADEDALWGDLRKKWRQYVNKARSGGVRVVDAGPERLDEFYRIYQETADRAGFLIRAQSAYRDVWDAFAPGGPRAAAVRGAAPTATPVATLFLVRAGTRVVEPYGGMTQAGADSRANYLLKWEAIRSSQGAGRRRAYDLWGLAHAGIAHFKTGFGGREIRYVGAWDLVLDPLGRRTYAVAQRRAGPGRAAAPRPAAAAASAVGIRGATAGADGGDGDDRDGRGASRARTARRLGRRGGRRPGRPRPAVAGLGGAPRGDGLARRGSTRSATRGRSRSSRPWPDRRRRLRVRAPRARWSPARPWTARRRRRRGVGRALAALRGPPRPTAASTSSPPTPRSRPTTPATGARSTPSGSTDPRDPAVAPPDGAPAARRRRRGRGHGRHREGDPAADPARRARRRRRACAGTPRPARRSEGSVRRDRGGRRGPAAGSTACCARPATGAGSGSPGPRSSSRGGAGRSPRATSSTSRRARAPRTATCSAASSCTATGGACRRPTPATARSGGATTRARCTSSAGARSSSRSRRAGPRWTSAASTCPAPAASRVRGRADVRPVRAQAVVRGRPGWRSPARRSASRAPWRYARRPRRGASRPRDRAVSAGVVTEPDDGEPRRVAERSSPPRSRPSRARSPACSPGSTTPASSAAPGGTTCRSASAGLGDVDVRGVAEDSRAVREGTLFVAVPGLPRRRPRVRRARPRRPAPRRRSSSTPCRRRRPAAARRRCLAGRARPRGGLVVRRPVADARRRRDHRHGRQDDDLVPRRRRPGGGGLSTGLIGTVETKVGDSCASGTRRTSRRPARPSSRRRSRRWPRPATRWRCSRRRRTRSRSTGSWASPTTPPSSPTSPTSTSTSTARSRRTARPSCGCSRRSPTGDGRTRARSSPGARGPRSRSSTATTRRRRGSRPPPARPGATVVTYGTDPAAARPRDRRSRRTPAGSASRYAAPSGDGRARAAARRPLQRPQRARGRRARRGLGLDPAAVRAGLESVEGVPGRMERIDEGQPFAVIVDYAHSPASLAGRPRPAGAPRGRAAAAGSSRCSGRAGSGTRPSAPRWAGSPAERCRLVVATDEDPRGEDRDAIVDEIVRGRGGGRRPARRRRARDPGPAGGDRGGVRAGASGRRRAARRKGHEPSILYARRRRSRGTRRRSRARRSRRWATAGALSDARLPVHAAPRRGRDRGRSSSSGCRPIAAGVRHRRGHGGGPPVGRHDRHREQRPADRPARPPRRPGARPRHRRDVPRPRRSASLDLTLHDLAPRRPHRRGRRRAHSTESSCPTSAAAR